MRTNNIASIFTVVVYQVNMILKLVPVMNSSLYLLLCRSGALCFLFSYKILRLLQISLGTGGKRRKRKEIMKNNWLYFMNPNDGCPYIFPLEPLLSKSFRGHTFSQLNSFVDNSLHQSRFLYIPGSMAFQEALKCMSKLAGALLFWFTSSSSSNLTQQISGNQHGPRVGSSHSLTQVKHITSTKHELTGFRFGYRSKGESSSLVVLGKISSFMRRLLCREAERLQSFPVFSFAAALVPPLENL